MRLIPTLLLLVSGGALAAQDAPPGAQSCTGCHSDRGRLSLATQSADDITTAMIAFRDGTRDGTIMGRLASGFTDAEIANISAWLADGDE